MMVGLREIPEPDDRFSGKTDRFTIASVCSKFLPRELLFKKLSLASDIITVRVSQ